MQVNQLPGRPCVNWRGAPGAGAPGLARVFSSLGWAPVVRLSVSHLEVAIVVRKLSSNLCRQPVPQPPGQKPGTCSSPELRGGGGGAGCGGDMDSSPCL